MRKKLNFLFGQDLLKRGLQSWQRRRYSKRTRYYHIKPRSDSRSGLACALDFIAGVMIFWLLVLIMLAMIMPVAKALLVSLPLAVVLGIAGSYYNTGKKKRRLQHHRMWMTGQKYRLEISNLRTREALAIFVRNLLSQLPEFEQVHLNQVDGLSLYALYRGLPVVIQCLIPAAFQDKAEEEVEAAYTGFVQRLSSEMVEQECKNTLIIATGEVHPRIEREIAVLRRKYRIELLNEEKLLRMVLRAKQQANHYTDDKQPVKGAINLPAGRKEIIFKHKKAFAYLAAAFILGVFYLVFKPAGFYRSLYIVFIMFNFMLALMCFIINRKKEELLELE